MAGRTITVERVIAAPRPAVFEWFSTATNWTAARLVLRVKLAKPGVDGGWGQGARREILCIGAWFDEEIVAHHPPSSFDYVIQRSVPPLRREGGRMEFHEVPAGTRVVWTRSATVPSILAPLLVVMALVGRLGFGHILAACDRSLSGKDRAN